MAAWVADCLAVDEAGCECKQSECDADAEAGEGASTVAFEGVLAFAESSSLSPSHLVP